MNTSSTRLSLEQFDQLTDTGEINTVVCAAPDPYGRLVGKRLTIQAFRSLGLSGEGVNASSFIFAVDLEMNPLGLAVSNADNGWADIRLVPDLTHPAPRAVGTPRRPGHLRRLRVRFRHAAGRRAAHHPAQADRAGRTTRTSLQVRLRVGVLPRLDASA